MADSGDQKSEATLRVVGDSQEVVRLESSPEKGSEKLEKRGIMPVQPKEVAQVRPRDAGGFDSGPLDVEGPEGDGRAIPMGWFYLLGLGMLGVVVWMGLQIFSGSGEPAGLSPKNRGTELNEQEARARAAAHFTQMEEVVSAFLAADTIEERLKYARHPERVRPLMEEYYRDREVKIYTFEQVANYLSASLSKHPFIALSVKTKEDESLPVLVEDREEGLLVDWESFVCYNPLSPEEFLEARPTAPVEMRVYVSFDHFYAYEFAEESEFICFRLEFRDFESPLFGYVRRGTTVEQKFREVFGPQGGNLRKPLILSLRFPEGGKGKRSVIIDDIESTLWAYPVNPAETTR